MTPNIHLFVNLDEIIATIDGAASVDMGNGLSVTRGSGRGKKYAPRWEWLVDHGKHDDPGHYSDMIVLDGFGRWTVCRRSGFNVKERRYETLDHAKGEIARFGKKQTEKVEAACRKRVEGWHCHRISGTECWNPKPWR
jgi:hypothetical protein